MLLSQVEGFLETARHRNLSRAAEVLHVTQPALTARIQALESELGTALFVRGRHGMAVTDAGRAFLPYAERALAALDVFKEKLAKRSVSLKALTASDPRPAGGGTYRVECSFLQGIPEDKAKALAKTIRQSGLKVQAQVQGDQLRVTGKSKNDLQQAIALLKERDEGLPLRFTNYR